MPFEGDVKDAVERLFSGCKASVWGVLVFTLSLLAFFQACNYKTTTMCASVPLTLGDVYIVRGFDAKTIMTELCNKLTDALVAVWRASINVLAINHFNAGLFNNLCTAFDDVEAEIGGQNMCLLAHLAVFRDALAEAGDSAPIDQLSALKTAKHMDTSQLKATEELVRSGRDSMFDFLSEDFDLEAAKSALGPAGTRAFTLEHLLATIDAAIARVVDADLRGTLATLRKDLPETPANFREELKTVKGKSSRPPKKQANVEPALAGPSLKKRKAKTDTGNDAARKKSASQ
ncbi:hypothetical protein Rhopal_007308-T1 [Rhodotorula paludigena]|uniref:Uncharacterized protein n=1 Tax=Rhodotorula paludigena TaxID=86838 RepID=A0AAV5GYH6_9BASI|nr:hypothetical protein Rhopal_007308-T1 [Rhodotorula paludigena]